MPITQAIALAYKLALLDGKHLPGHTYKCALIKPSSSGTIDKTITSYTALGADEVAAGGGYTTGGATLAGRTAVLVGDAALLDFTDPTWPTSTIAAAGALVYNDSLAGKDVLFVLDFGGTITSTNDTFTVDLPTQGAGTSLFRLP